MRVTAKEAKRLVVNRWDNGELDDICLKIDKAARQGDTLTFFEKLSEDAWRWLEINGYELERHGKFIMVSWMNAAT